MQRDSIEKAFARRARLRRATTSATVRAPSRRGSNARTPSANGYILAAGAAAAALFFLLWWMLHTSGDEAPWIPAGLSASVVMLVALAARGVVVRRAWTRHLLEHDGREQFRNTLRTDRRRNEVGNSGISDAFAAALRAIQRQCAEANAPDALPEAHLDAYVSCQEYLDSVNESLRSGAIRRDTRIALRSGTEQVRALARRHMLGWARESVRNWTREAQQRVRVSDKIETAQRALEVLGSALARYPDEPELRDSEAAINEFVASVKVTHWVELAERAAFKGHYSRAIDRYRDALYFLSRAEMNEQTRTETAERIGREIELLRARLKTRTILSNPTE